MQFCGGVCGEKRRSLSIGATKSSGLWEAFGSTVRSKTKSICASVVEFVVERKFWVLWCISRLASREERHQVVVMKYLG